MSLSTLLTLPSVPTEISNDSNGKSSICIYLDTEEDLLKTVGYPNIRQVASGAARIREQLGLSIEYLYFYVAGEFRTRVPIDLVFMNPY